MVQEIGITSKYLFKSGIFRLFPIYQLPTQKYKKHNSESATTKRLITSKLLFIGNKNLYSELIFLVYWFISTHKMFLPPRIVHSFNNNTEKS